MIFKSYVEFFLKQFGPTLSFLISFYLIIFPFSFLTLEEIFSLCFLISTTLTFFVLPSLSSSLLFFTFHNLTTVLIPLVDLGYSYFPLTVLVLMSYFVGSYLESFVLFDFSVFQTWMIVDLVIKFSLWSFLFFIWEVCC